MIFEKADLNDIPELIGMRKEYLTEDHGEMPPDTVRKISENLLTYFPAHLNKDLSVFVCRDCGSIVGCCFLGVFEKPANPSFISGRTGTVLNVYTKAEYRRKGIAGRLMKMLLSEAAELKLDYVELKATDCGYELYRSLGFKDTVSEYRDMKYVID